MKTIINTNTALAIAAALAVGHSNAEEIDLSMCPVAVKKTIESNSAGGVIDDIDRIAIDGKEIYIAEINLPQDREMKIYIAGDGELLKTVEDLKLSEVPEPVRSAVLGLEGSFDDVDKVTAGGKITYQVEMDRTGKPDLEVTIAEDGKIIRQAEEAND